MNRSKIKSILLALVALGIIFTFSQGLAQPHAVLGAYGDSSNYVRWNTTPQRYMRYRGSYYSPQYITWNHSTNTPDVSGPAQTVQSSEQTRMLKLVNEERQKAGVAPLILDIELSQVANVKAKDMVDNNYFNHDSPTYGSPFTMMKDFGIKYTAAGENLAGYNNVDKAHVGLMTSDGHRRNILNSNFTHIGIGVQKSPRYGYVFVQMFIRK